ncbi:MAG: AAA family ATPase [Lentisphaerae bacterium]|nr:AAA family ATPase [Lentisphaerota bacterium]
MKITVDNLGPLTHAEFELGDITIICGRNNTGKTYATYATYGFLDYWRSGYTLDVPSEIIKDVEGKTSATIKLEPHIATSAKYLEDASTEYSGILDKIFAGKPDLFSSAKFAIQCGTVGTCKSNDIEIKTGPNAKSVVSIHKAHGSNELVVSLVTGTSEKDIPPRHLIRELISEAIKTSLFEHVVPRPFMASAERTGSAIFQKELDFTRNRLVDLLGEKTASFHPFKLLGKFTSEYPLAVRKNVDFIRELPNITNRESFILKEHPDVLAAFANIIGGEYKVSRDGEIQYVPTANKRIKLKLVESSSSVRSMLDIGFYLRHIARPGDLLMVDEPELNLHPENQRLVARLFARLANLGIKVFITTHSDYIIKELNTLIMLGKDSKNTRRIAKAERYVPQEFLKADKLRVYIAEEGLIKKDGHSRKSRCQTLVPASIDSFLGIEARSFDTTINDMNRIQEDLVWGGDE